MLRPQAIIVATDFSGNAQRAVEQAARLAKEWNAALTLVHVFNDSAWASIKAVYDLSRWEASDPVASARQKLAVICAELVRDHGVSADAEVLVGRASKKIHKFVAARQAGLLVVGEHGENWLRDAVLGGTALKALEAAQIPVLLVRRPAVDRYQRIIIATDFSETATRAARLTLELFPDVLHHRFTSMLCPSRRACAWLAPVRKISNITAIRHLSRRCVIWRHSRLVAIIRLPGNFPSSRCMAIRPPCCSSKRRVWKPN